MNYYYYNKVDEIEGRSVKTGGNLKPEIGKETGDDPKSDDPKTETGDDPKSDDPKTETGDDPKSDDPKTETGDDPKSDDPKTKTGKKISKK